ncbi:uncharacterized protein LOC134764250 [Penaeus indicus]|uniref:uncharacterized protein LOC134764250 n=1 Tax=Penaeus indicus TaxID=29960 RepID=UPI00300CDAFE
MIRKVERFTYLGSDISSTENNVAIRIAKSWNALNKLRIIWKSNLSNNLKRDFFRATVESILLYGCTTWTLTRKLENRLDGTYTRIPRAVLNKSWQQHPTKEELYRKIPPITPTIRERRTRFARHCHRSKGELISSLLLWVPKHGRSNVGRPAKTFVKRLTDIGYAVLPGAMETRGQGVDPVDNVSGRVRAQPRI